MLRFVSRGQWRDGWGQERAFFPWFQYACLASSCNTHGFFSTQLLQYHRVSSTQLPLAPTSGDFGSEGSSVRQLSPEGCFSASSTRAMSQWLPPRSHSYPLQQDLDLSPGGTLSKVLCLSRRVCGCCTRLLYISLYVYFPLVNLLLLHSPVVVNNSLYKLSLYKLLCGFYLSDWTLTDADVKHTFSII